MSDSNMTQSDNDFKQNDIWQNDEKYHASYYLLWWYNLKSTITNNIKCNSQIQIFFQDSEIQNTNYSWKTHYTLNNLISIDMIYVLFIHEKPTTH